MKKAILTIVIILLSNFNLLKAQEAKLKIGIATDISFPVKDDIRFLYRIGYGGSLKVLRNINKNGELTFTATYLKLQNKDIPNAYGDKFDMIHLLAGYRYNFKGFYAEPQVGYSLYQARNKLINYNNSKNLLAWAIGLGYEFKSFDVSARYQFGHLRSDVMSFAAVRLGYNFSIN